MSIQILPGTHVDVVAGERAAITSVTGVVSMPLEMDWGDKITVINQGDSTSVSLGYDMSNVKLKTVKEVMNYATKLILYRSNLTGAAKASGSLATGITATAKYFGVRGNDISITVTGTTAPYTIKTYLGGVLKDTQSVATAAAFVANDWVSLTTSTGTFAAVTVTLAGGANGTIDVAAVDDYTTEMQKYQFNVIAYCGTGVNTRTKLQAFVADQRAKNNMIQMVMSGVAADNIAIYNSMSAGGTADYELTAPEACSTLGGIIASRGITGSLTHFQVIGWTHVTSDFTYEQQQAAVIAGQLIVTMLYGVPTVLYDINSLITYTDTAPKDFRKGLVIRTLDNYAANLKMLLDTKAIGKIRNGVDGRSQIKGMIATMTTESYMDKGYIENTFTADDVTVVLGTDSDEITATVAIQALDTVDKAQITVTSL